MPFMSCITDGNANLLSMFCLKGKTKPTMSKYINPTFKLIIH